MKNKIYSLAILAALSLAPLTGLAEETKRPGKASDGVTEPKVTAPATAVPAPRDPAKPSGKASDAVVQSSVAKNKFSGKITAVDKEAMTVTVDDVKMGKHTLHVSDATMMKKGDEKGTWADLKVGEEVHGVCVKVGDEVKAERLMIGSK